MNAIHQVQMLSQRSCPANGVALNLGLTRLGSSSSSIALMLAGVKLRRRLLHLSGAASPKGVTLLFVPDVVADNIGALIPSERLEKEVRRSPDEQAREPAEDE